MCFVAMPFGRKAPPGKRKPLIDFDQVYRVAEKAILDANIECVRADFEASGGFIHRPMYERLLVAEYVVADLTLGNPNVAYEVGVRHGASSGATILICASSHVNMLPFDLRPLRVIAYDLGEDGRVGRAAANKLKTALRERIELARRRELPADNPIVQVTRLGPSAEVDHSKTDVFLHRMRFASELGERVSEALRLPNADEAVKRLADIEESVLSGEGVVRDLHTGLMAIYLGYREKGAYERMVALYSRFPPELQSTPVAREQLALALNRLAERAEKPDERAAARQLRDRAFAALEGLPQSQKSSETFGILGRIYKGWSEAEARAGNRKQAEALLKKAIEAYEAGLRADPRDYFPGVNAVTLRLRRNTEEDRKKLPQLLAVVRFAVDRAPEPDKPVERYWQTATKLELACATRDWDAAEEDMSALLAIRVDDWMRMTTIDNLKMQRAARAEEGEPAERLDQILSALQPGA
jgi:tetratricopeptide (TPR) repeat protein